MARRKESLLDDIASMPWPFGFVVGIIAYVGARHFGGLLAPLAWIFLVACWAAAAMSFFKGLKRKRLLEIQTSLDSLQSMSWREFETLVGEAFRRLGYFVEETGGGGKDGGIDLILSSAGRKELVQCKQWKTRQVKVSVVREMWGFDRRTSRSLALFGMTSPSRNSAKERCVTSSATARSHKRT